MRKFIYLFLSLFLVVAPTIQQANAASSWSITGAVSAGSRTVVSATKSGYKSAVNVAPTAGRLALKLGKGANWAALVYAAIQLAPDLADIDSFKPNYPAGKVDFKVRTPTAPGTVRTSNKGQECIGVAGPVLESCIIRIYSPDYSYYTGIHIRKPSDFNPLKPVYELWGTHNGSLSKFITITPGAYTAVIVTDEAVSITAAAAQMIKNANAGHAPSQAATRETATEMVIGGQFDQDLLSGAVPTSDTRPLVPSVPGNGNGNVTHGSDVGIGEGGTTGATPGQQADAAKDAADASKKAAEAAADAAKAAAEDARKAADDAQDLINSGADTAAIDAAKAAQAAAEKAAADSKGAADAATKAAAERARAAEAAADRARIDADARAKAAEAAADAAIAAAKAAAEAEKAAAQAAADAAVRAAEKARAEADARAKAAEEAAKAADRAKAEAAKPFELPAFCSWATPVCDFIDWVKREPSIDESDGTLDIETQNETMHEGILERLYISMPAQCPNDPVLEFMGARIPFPMSVFCQFASMMKPLILLFAYIKGLSIIGSGLS